MQLVKYAFPVETVLLLTIYPDIFRPDIWTFTQPMPEPALPQPTAEYPPDASANGNVLFAEILPPIPPIIDEVGFVIVSEMLLIKNNLQSPELYLM